MHSSTDLPTPPSGPAAPADAAPAASGPSSSDSTEASGSSPPLPAPEAAARARGGPATRLRRRLAEGRRLLFLSFPFQGPGALPAWVADATQAARALGFAVYHPFESLLEQCQHDQVLRAALRTGVAVDPARAAALSLEPLLCEPAGQRHLDLFARADSSSPVADAVVFRDLFVLLRSTALLVGLAGDSAVSGMTMTLFYAHAMGIPAWLVSDRVANSPWLTTHAAGIVRSADVSEHLVDTVG